MRCGGTRSILLNFLMVKNSDMIIDVEIACQRPEKVDVSAVIDAFPYGQISTKSVLGGLDIQHPANSQCPPTIIAHAAIIVSLNLATKGG